MTTHLTQYNNQYINRIKFICLYIYLNKTSYTFDNTISVDQECGRFPQSGEGLLCITKNDAPFYYLVFRTISMPCLFITLNFMSRHLMITLRSTTGATSGTGTAYPTGAPAFIRIFCGVRVAQALAFCVVF
jgi:hypothetical protein